MPMLLTALKFGALTNACRKPPQLVNAAEILDLRVFDSEMIDESLEKVPLIVSFDEQLLAHRDPGRPHRVQRTSRPWETAALMASDP